jgi:hypothetical protein
LIMKKPMESTLAVLGAATLGVGLMYLLDPESGRRRRATLAAAAGHAVSSTGDAVGATIHGATDSARTAASRISGYTHHLAEKLHDRAHAALDHATQRASDAHEHMLDRAHEIVAHARQRAGLERESHPVAMATGITAATIGVLGLGAGMMYILDPAKGRARRAWMWDKMVSATRQTGREARHYGRHLGNRLKGRLHEVGRNAPWHPAGEPSMPSSAPLHQ